jgi:hypothetical protein
VLAHYVKGFGAAGYSQEVLSATPEGEQHRFTRDHESTHLALLRRPGELAEVRLKMSSLQMSQADKRRRVRAHTTHTGTRCVCRA